MAAPTPMIAIAGVAALATAPEPELLSRALAGGALWPALAGARPAPPTAGPAFSGPFDPFASAALTGAWFLAAPDAADAFAGGAPFPAASFVAAWAGAGARAGAGAGAGEAPLGLAGDA
ncbi:hypothetical protein MNEG_9047 [Monoraphidium neglectum]|uniref:Uncharacterized protein n=1 Tax=Monoraphidium neglectum TaxID=145388 RepID=A0A0D2KTY2_9CHLO|nr:hypothetical protein MNEG_9047 [Monoraphidium neglectum]KIY98913.1 hypothetical protein MNEG_9047 [Monoraphidium neglectum]|eukprot:XP_013897933.1 hypothetical protein MNEG_9047 [Monoraphidium neglectum]